MTINADVNYWAVLLAAAAYYILGSLWYSPKLFGHLWMKHEGLHPHQVEFRWQAFVGEAIIDLIIAYVLALVLDIAKVTTPLEGLVVALWLWIGFVGTTQFSGVLWGRKSFKGFLIYAGFTLIGFLMMGAILAALR
jgi:hypothetical protein